VRVEERNTHARSVRGVGSLDDDVMLAGDGRSDSGDIAAIEDGE
jgi:hypothetical protein